MLHANLAGLHIVASVICYLCAAKLLMGYRQLQAVHVGHGHRNVHQEAQDHLKVHWSSNIVQEISQSSPSQPL